jgi:glycosyltransferase involved in cell wall biosynthesis
MILKNNSNLPQVLIVCPRFLIGRGVANYYKIIRKYFSIKVEFFDVGKKKRNENTIETMIRLLCDTLVFYKITNKKHSTYRLVIINPSFLSGALIRDGTILSLSKYFGKKTIVFFRGWSNKHQKMIEHLYFKPFFYIYNKADAFIVLSSDFKEKLMQWGFKQPIYVETTVVDDDLLTDFSLKKKLETVKNEKQIQLLYLAAVMKEKGIREALNGTKLLVESGLDVYLTVAGDGKFMEEAKLYAIGLGLDNRVSFRGFLSGEQKKLAFLNSDIYIFPSYREGMPNSVLEAMAFGLPCVTTRVGGLKDFFVDGRHGFVIDKNDPNGIADAVKRISENKKLMTEMSSAAHNYAVEHFLASNVTRRLEAICVNILTYK